MMVWDIYCHLLGDFQAGAVLGMILVFMFPGRVEP